jgi:protein SCO1/2
VNPRVLIALVLACAFALGAVVLAAGGRHDGASAETAPGHFAGSVLPRGVKAPDMRLRDQNGRPVSMRALRGKPVLVSFLYTTCDNTCPTQAQIAKGALDDLGHDVPFVAIAVDPPRDNADRARRFVSKVRMTGRMRFVLGSRDQLRPLWKGYAIQPQRKNIEHQGRFVLVDRDGIQRVSFPLGQATPELVAHDLRMLEKE